MTSPEDPSQPGPWDPPATPSYPPPTYGAPPPPPPYGGPPGYGGPQYGGPQWNQPQWSQPQPPGPPLEAIASMGSRLGARIVDGILVLIVFFAIAIPAGIASLHSHTITYADGTTSTTIDNGHLIALGLLIALVTAVYEVSFIALRGATLGKQWVGIKVAHGDTAGVPGWGPSLIRWVIPTAVGIACSVITLLIYVSPFFDNTGRRQGWHDKAANTFVIKTSWMPPRQ